MNVVSDVLGSLVCGVRSVGRSWNLMVISTGSVICLGCIVE